MNFICIKEWVGVLPGNNSGRLTTFRAGSVISPSTYDIPGLIAQGVRLVELTSALQTLLDPSDRTPTDFHIAATQLALSSPGGGGVNVFRQSFVNADLTAGVLTVTHNLNQQYNTFTVYDDSNEKIEPDLVTATDANTLTVDLSNFGVIAGTWNIVVEG